MEWPETTLFESNTTLTGMRHLDDIGRGRCIVLGFEIERLIGMPAPQMPVQIVVRMKCFGAITASLVKGRRQQYQAVYLDKRFLRTGAEQHTK
jgi:hypothetical protein